MSKLSEKLIYNIIKPCGLAPKKSNAIKRLSKILIEKHNGKIPRSFNDLEMLPGVGHKTAGVSYVSRFWNTSFSS